NVPRPAIFSKPRTTLTVECSTVDDFCKQNRIEAIDVLKIDAEGCDLNVLLGAKDFLREGRIRFVFTEFNAIENTDPSVQMTTFLPLYRTLSNVGLRFVATYTDWFFTNQPLMVANALFVLPP